MRIKHLIILLFSTALLINISCDYQDKKTKSFKQNKQPKEHADGLYCAKVQYYNANTGTSSVYNLNVVVENGKLTVIHWPNGGWLDSTHFYPQKIFYGECKFTSDRGYQYTVTLQELGGCTYTDEYKIRRDVNNDIESITCPNCGSDKNTYDDYCYYCQSEIEEEEQNICSSCGSYSYFLNYGLCDDCESN